MKNDFNDLINKYFDNDLNSEELKKTNELLETNSEFKTLFITHKFVHENLSEIPVHHAPENIAEFVLKKISPKLKIKSQQFYFFKAVLFTLSLLLVISLFVFFNLIEDLKIIKQTTSYLDYSVDYFQPIITFVGKLIRNDIFRTLSGLTGLIILISFYFTLNSFKNFKNRIKQF